MPRRIKTVTAAKDILYIRSAKSHEWTSINMFIILLFTCLTITVEIPTRSESPPSVVASFIARLTAFLEQIVYEAVPSMASIPVTSFSASKIHDHVRAKHKHDDFPSGEESQKIHRHNPFEIDKMLPKYNGKLMNSIWGQYNLYAAHAFQKNSEGSYGFVDPLNIPQVKNLWNSLRTTH